MSQSASQPAQRAPDRGVPIVAMGLCLAAAAAFVAVAIVAEIQGGRATVMALGAPVIGLAGILVAPPATRTGALLLAWNALGIGAGLLLLGLFSVGALIAFPVILIVLALSFWPRTDALSVFSLPGLIAQVGGFLVILALAWMPLP